MTVLLDSEKPQTLVYQYVSKTGEKLHGHIWRHDFFSGYTPQENLRKWKKPFEEVAEFPEFCCDFDILYEGLTEKLPNKFRGISSTLH